MDNPVSNFAVREFQLEAKVHVDITPLGTVGFRFVEPGDAVDAAALSTLNIAVVPVPKPVPADERRRAHAPNPGVEAIDGISAPQAAELRWRTLSRRSATSSAW